MKQLCCSGYIDTFKAELLEFIISCPNSAFNFHNIKGV